MVKIKAILFDIDGVLVDSSEANTRYVQDIIQKSGYKRPSKRTAEQGFNLALIDRLRLVAKGSSENDVQKMFNLPDKVKLYRINLLKIPKDSRKVVKMLHKRYKLGLVTSRLKETTDLFFKKFGLRDCFDVVVTFNDYTRSKPHPEPLFVACKRLGIRPTEAIYVGDSITDIEAAKAAKMGFILYNNDKAKFLGNRMDSFADLPKLIQSIEDKGRRF